MSQNHQFDSQTKSQHNFCKTPSHQQNLIQYFCLDDLCFSKRLFCHACAKIDHKKHRIGRIDRLIQPLSLLNINSFHQDSSAIYEQLKHKIQEFYQVLNQLKNSFEKTLSEIQKTTFFQVKSILETFSNQKIQEVQNIFLSQNPDQEGVRNAISMINFLQFQGVEDCYTVKNVCDIMLCKMTKTLQKTYSKFQTIFEKLIKNIKENDFINQLRLYNINLQNQAKRKMDQGFKKSSYQNPHNYEDDKQSELQTVDQPNQSTLKKKTSEFMSQIKNVNKSQKPQSKTNIINKFKAFFEEDQEGQVEVKKIKKEKNVIVVKKQQ